MDINLIRRIEKRNHNVYNKLISIEKPLTPTFYDITGLTIRDVKIMSILELVLIGIVYIQLLDIIYKYFG